MNLLKNTPQMSAISVARNVGMIISVGVFDPSERRMAITVAGIKVMALVLIVRNMHMAFVAVPAFGFNLFNSSIAFNPNGVAALESPRKFAAIFDSIAPIAGCSGGTSGNNLTISGLANFASKVINPAASAIFI